MAENEADRTERDAVPGPHPPLPDGARLGFRVKFDDCRISELGGPVVLVRRRGTMRAPSPLMLRQVAADCRTGAR